MKRSDLCLVLGIVDLEGLRNYLDSCSLWTPLSIHAKNVEWPIATQTWRRLFNFGDPSHSVKTPTAKGQRRVPIRVAALVSMGRTISGEHPALLRQKVLDIEGVSTLGNHKKGRKLLLPSLNRDRELRNSILGMNLGVSWDDGCDLSCAPGMSVYCLIIASCHLPTLHTRSRYGQRFSKSYDGWSMLAPTLSGCSQIRCSAPLAYLV